jgi:hypothetical protein
MDVDSYCRDIEAHLCRRNAGHLVRISGPAFDLVRGWAQRGIPFNVAEQGIDRYIDRSNARGLRRRPARIEFCEADVLDAFDAWKRAVGIHRAESEASEGEAGDADGGGAARPRRRESLSMHLDRVIVRLTSMRTGDVPEAWDAVLEHVVRTLDAMHPAARRARADARDRILADLDALDASLLEQARTAAGADLLAEAGREATAELEPFATRLSPAAYAAAHTRCENRVLRERLRLPTIALE